MIDRHAHNAFFVGRAEHACDVIVGGVAKDPRRTDAIGTRANLQAQTLTGQLRLAILVERVRQRNFVVGGLGLAIKDVIGRNVEQRAARLLSGQGQILRTHGIDAPGSIWIALARLHVDQRRRINDQIGPGRAQTVQRPHPICDIDFIQVPGQHLMFCAQHATQLAAQHALSANHCNFHAALSFLFVHREHRGGTEHAEKKQEKFLCDLCVSSISVATFSVNLFDF